MKKTIFFLFPIFLILSGCYIYRPYSDEAADMANSTVSMKPETVPGAKPLPGQDKEARDLKGDTAPSERRAAAENEKKRQEEVEQEKREQEEKEKKAAEEKEKLNTGRSASLGSDSHAQSRRSAQKEAEAASTPRMAGIKGKILPDHYYKITVAEREFKIQADQWEGDTLVSHILRKPKKVLRFHENQIDEELIKERVFSKPYSDVITVSSYAAGGAAILLLVL